MSFERFIARRFMPRRGREGGFSGPLSSIAVVGIALGVVVMVMAVSILRGFQGDISGKVAGFGSHMTVTSFAPSEAYADNPVAVDSSLLEALRSVPGVRHVQCFATKGGMVKTDEQIYGILFRGLDKGYDTSFYHSCLVEGRLPVVGTQDSTSAASNDVLISTTIGSKLGLKVGDKMRTYFWSGDNYRSRAFTVCGIYNTDLAEMDELYMVGDLRQVQRIEGWGDSLVGGYELLVSDFDNLDATAYRVAGVLPYDLQLRSIVEQHPALFSWLDLLNANIALILTIMCLVSAVAIVSALLIMIFEKSATIGLLKALGACNAAVRRIFMLKAAGLIATGVAIGDGVAMALSVAQSRWHLLTLDPESYSMAYVPVEIDPWVYVAVSLGTLAVCVAALLLPAAHISRVSPAKTMRVEG
ncbi:MAG: ABC transporter permease [Bacteroidales bacterium]|nr:ABC transporter permease [Bacteroidales bacterium]